MSKQLKRKIRIAKFITSRVLAIALIIAALVLICKTVVNYATYPEKYLTTARYHLMLDIEDGDTESIERYMDVYIANDMYLFDGPFTIRACCDRYDLDYNEVYKEFNNSDYANFQEYFNHEIKK